MWRFEFRLALRHLVSGGGQTVLTVGAVALATLIIILITSLVRGLQNRILYDLIGTFSHVSVRPLESEVRLLPVTEAANELGVAPTANLVRTVDKTQSRTQRRDIEEPERLAAQIRTFPQVRAVAPSVTGQAFVMRGAEPHAISVIAAEPAQEEQIVSLQKDMIAGRWQTLRPQEIVIGWRLADEIGVALGDRIRLQSGEGKALVATVAGIFSRGNRSADAGQVFLRLRDGQSLFAAGRTVSVIEVKLDDPWQANAVADRIAASLVCETDSWMRDQTQVVNTISAQNATSSMITLFILLSSSLGIASVLIVSVVQKSRQIGILKSIGARDRQILVVFALEGILLALAGAACGAGSGYLLLRFLSTIKQVARVAGRPNQLFPVVFEPWLFGFAAGAAVLATTIAAILPARRAARMNPVEVIRGG